MIFIDLLRLVYEEDLSRIGKALNALKTEERVQAAVDYVFSEQHLAELSKLLPDLPKLIRHALSSVAIRLGLKGLELDSGSAIDQLRQLLTMQPEGEGKQEKPTEESPDSA